MNASASIFGEFLEHTTRAGLELAVRSDVVRLERLPVEGEGLFRLTFAVPYLARAADGRLDVAPGPLPVMIRMGPDYLRHASPLETVQVHEASFWHPNYRWPVLCVGEVRPGMMLPSLIRHVYEIVTYQNYATDDGLNPEACVRLRNEPALLDRLPRTPRLLRAVSTVTVAGPGAVAAGQGGVPS